MKRALMFSLVLFAAAANAATIRGKVVYPNGAACSGASAIAADANRNQTTAAYTDREGMFYIHDVPPGRYVVTVTKGKTTRMITVTVTQAAYAEAGTVPVQ
jgi:chloramphenicol 3-O-phosphotransferase